MTLAKQLFQELRRDAQSELSIDDLPDFETELVTSDGNPTNETLVSQALFHCCLDWADEDTVSSLSGFISIAVFGVPLWRVFLRAYLKVVARWAWKKLNP